MGEISYQTGFGNQFATEAEPDVLPTGQNSPQKVSGGLYTEQLTGTAFTAPRVSMQRSWMYRMRPSVRHLNNLQAVDSGLIRTSPDQNTSPTAAQLRWDPFPSVASDTLATGSDGSNRQRNAAGGTVHHFVASQSMGDTHLSTAAS